MSENIIQGDFPFEEIRDDVCGGNGDYFDSPEEAMKATGYDRNKIWSVVISDDDDDGVTTYGPSHHYINVIGYIATKEAHDGNTIYEEHWGDDLEDDLEDDPQSGPAL